MNRYSQSVTFWLLLSFISVYLFFFFFSSRRRHTRLQGDWSSDVCSSDLRETLRRLFGELDLLGAQRLDRAAVDAVGGEELDRLFARGARLLAHRQQVRSEERRVGKECRSRWSPYH